MNYIVVIMVSAQIRNRDTGERTKHQAKCGEIACDNKAEAARIAGALDNLFRTHNTNQQHKHAEVCVVIRSAARGRTIITTDMLEQIVSEYTAPLEVRDTNDDYAA